MSVEIFCLLSARSCTLYLDMRDESSTRVEVSICASTRWFGFMNSLGLFEFDGFG